MRNYARGIHSDRLSGIKREDTAGSERRTGR